MSVRSIRPFEPVIKDAAENFHGMQVVYLCWDKHLMFYAPIAKMLPPSMTFGQLIEAEITPAYSRHPDFAKIDWSAVQWSKEGDAFTPALDKSLVEQGITHKTAIHFNTPGLNGINGTGF